VFEKSLRALAWAGRLVTCGATTGTRAQVDLRHIFFKSQSILGSTMGSKGEYHQLVKLYERGLFKPVIDRVLPLAEIADAHRALEAREVFGKIVMTL
jgi:NADPH:quinone reductase-like Zn-dependent oxidoreductase